MVRTAAVLILSLLAVATSSEIPSELVPPDHESLQHLTFLEVLHVEQGLAEPKASGHRMPSPPVPSLVNLAIQGPGLILQALMGGVELPGALDSKYEDGTALGSGTFGITFLATRKSDHQKVAVKVFKYGGVWASPGTCTKLECIAHLKMSASECLDTQRIHQADSLDQEASDHVVRCLFDGITPGLEGGTSQSQPYYIELSFAGRDDVDKWWGKRLKKSLADEAYVQDLKSVAKGVYLGLRFMGESKTAVHYVHADLKPQNMVVNEDTGQVVIVDMGTVLCDGDAQTCAKKTSGTTPIFRPPEVSHLSLFQPQVGWQKPVWSFDVHSAALSILGMATDGKSGLVMPGGETLSAVPVITYMLSNGVQNSMANWPTVRRVVECAEAEAQPNTQPYFNALLRCTNEESIVHYKKLFEERLAQVRDASGDARKAALASLVHCRTSKTSPAALYAMPPLPETHVPKFFWTLVDDWMKTGFDEVLLKALSTEPKDRPKPSAILEAQWFTADAPQVSGTEVEFTCPDYPLAPARMQYMASIIAGVLALVSCCVCCLGTCVTCCGRQIPAWKWATVWGGFMTMVSPLFARFLIENVFFWTWLLLMVPLGLAMMTLNWIAGDEDEKSKRKRLTIITLATAAGIGCSMTMEDPMKLAAKIPMVLTFGPVQVGAMIWMWALCANSLRCCVWAGAFGLVSAVSVMTGKARARTGSTGSTVELGVV